MILDVEAESAHAGDVARDELLALLVRLGAVREEAVVPCALSLRAGAASMDGMFVGVHFSGRCGSVRCHWDGSEG